MNKTILITISIIVSYVGFSQDKFGQNVINAKQIQLENHEFHQKSDFGVGVGLDYGGIVGVTYMYSPIKYLGTFGSVGYFGVNVGFQVGVAGYILPKTNKYIFKPFAKIMYGSNRIIKIDGSPQYDKMYFGFTPGIGLEIRIGKYRKHGFNLDLNYPINSEQFKTDVDYIKHNTSLELKYTAVTFSFGYHFLLIR